MPGGQRLRFMLRALRSRNYRLFFAGQIVSLAGTWLSMVATSWLVYRLAHESRPHQETLLLGLVNFAGQFPIFVLSPLMGVLADRWDRRRVLMVTQTGSMLQSFALAALALTGTITIPQIIVLNAVMGVINSLDVPARQSLLIDMVERQDLSNAIALNSSMVHAARLVGPALAGMLIYYFSEGICFLLDGFSFFGVLLALFAMRIAPAAKQEAPKPLRALQEGLGYAWQSPPIRAILILVGITSLMVMSQSALMPVFASDVLAGDERTLGLLLGSAGLGALAGSLYLASRGSVLGLGRVIVISAVVLGTGLVVFSASTSLLLSLAVSLFTGGAMVTQMAACNTVLQTIVEDDKRGRIMSLFTMAFMGVAPFGSLSAGVIATWIGPRWTLGLAGSLCVLQGVVFSLQIPKLRPHVVPIYIRKGILPDPGFDAANSASSPVA
jgi:MFS family permease